MKNLLKGLRKSVGFLVAVAALLVALEIPKLKKKYIRARASENVVKLLGSEAGGTGFIINTDNGTQVIITNRHVCEGNTVLNAETGEDSRTLKILQMSTEHDLCVVEGIPGRSGLNLGSEPDVGDNLYILGHPYLLPQTLTSGELSSKTSIPTVTSEYTGVEKCDAVRPVTFMGFEFGKVCVNFREVFFVTVPSAPGNSGSPVLNEFGHVVGVLFAGYPVGASNVVVPGKFIKRLIKMY